MLGLKVKESCLDRSSRLVVLGVSEGRADIKPLARELGRSQERVMEAGAESLRVSWDETQQISLLVLQTRRLGPQMRSGRARAHLEEQTSPLTPPSPLGSPSLPSAELFPVEETCKEASEFGGKEMPPEAGQNFTPGPRIEKDGIRRAKGSPEMEAAAHGTQGLGHSPCPGWHW